MIVGLRIDVDTFRGTYNGVPRLCEFLAKNSINATFFFSVGPDNMGRHLWRLIWPLFLWKMLRSRAPNLYGWDILFRGTLWQGPIIGKKLGDIIRSTADLGHEAGIHAWDHHAWQVHVDKMDKDAIYRSLNMGVELLTQIIGRAPVSSAAPAWKCNNLVLMEKIKFSFRYNSDCRGESIFRPIVDGKELSQPQVPVTLPTYDEVIGYKGVSKKNYNEYMLSLLRPDKLNVLTVHAEVEGMACFDLFEQFVKMAKSRGVLFVPLESILKNTSKVGRAAIVTKKVPGRHGWVSCQAPLETLKKEDDP